MLLGCSGNKNDSATVPVERYAKGFADGKWHKVEIPISAFIKGAGAKFDPRSFWEFRIATWSAAPRHFDIYIDDIAARKAVGRRSDHGGTTRGVVVDARGAGRERGGRRCPRASPGLRRYWTRQFAGCGRAAGSVQQVHRHAAHAYAGDAGIPSRDATTAAGPYAWKNVVIKGGGFVSGIVMSPALQGWPSRARTSGAPTATIRATSAGHRSPIGSGTATPSLIGIESIAADPVDPESGLRCRRPVPDGRQRHDPELDRHGTDLGPEQHLGAYMGGNADGRSMGERLAVDPNLPSTLYFGSRNQAC